MREFVFVCVIHMFVIVSLITNIFNIVNAYLILAYKFFFMFFLARLQSILFLSWKYLRTMIFEK